MYITTSTFFIILSYIDSIHVIDTVRECPKYFKAVTNYPFKTYLSNVHQRNLIHKIETALSPELSPHIHIRTYKRKPPQENLVFNEPTECHYHLHSNCSTLNNEYKNLIIPSELEYRAREHTTKYGEEHGKKVIEEFREYAKHRRKIMGYDFVYTDAFAVELMTRFNLKDKPKLYTLKNSGYGEFDVGRLSQDICKQYDKELLDFFYSDDLGKQLYYMYKSNISVPVMERLILQYLQKDDSEKLSEKDYIYVQNKIKRLKEILQKITQLYIRLICTEYSTDISNWNEIFLQKLGIRPCGVCHNEFIKPKRNTTYDTVTPVITKQPPPETDDLPF